MVRPIRINPLLGVLLLVTVAGPVRADDESVESRYDAESGTLIVPLRERNQALTVEIAR